MNKIEKCMLTLLVLLMLGSVVGAQAQEVTARAAPRLAGPSVTISTTEGGVRFAALGSFGKMRLEVFNADSVSLYSSDFRTASVQDWKLEDKYGQPLPDGAYLCVVTLRDLSGRLSTKQGMIALKGGQPSLQMTDSVDLSVVDQDKSLAPVIDPANTPVTTIGNDGNNGQVVNTRGALTFRSGDFFGGKDKEMMRLTPEGYLGIGTSKPEFKLDVAGAIRAQEGFIFRDGSTLNVNNQGGLTLTTTNGKDALAVAGGGSVTPSIAGTGTVNRIAKWTPDSNTLGDSGITETNSGFVGIGTTTPDGPLNVQGTVPSPLGHMSVIRTTGSNNGFGLLMDATGTGNNNLGLGVNGVQKASFAWDNARHFLGFVNFEYAANDFALRLNNDGSLTFHDGTGGPASERFRITNTGNVGIGTATPASKLDVAGDINVTGNAMVAGNIAAKYQDVAEWVQARQPLAAGTVVSLDQTRINAVTPSARSYDSRVAGVVSGQPGVILGESGPNKVLVATTGRVKVKVDATHAPIHIGDLLVSSATPGVAMRSLPFRVNGRLMHRPGTIIGKALEALPTGKGEILVLLSLQ
jgi:hypothetical protein